MYWPTGRLADWPGLAARDLHQQRDLRPTRDMRTLMKGLLRDHLGIAPEVLANQVFPGSSMLAPLDGLIRA